MSRKLFEYFFDAEELEPFYSELTRAGAGRRRCDRQPKESVHRPADSQGSRAIEVDNSRSGTAANTETQNEFTAPKVAEGEPAVATAKSEVPDHGEHGTHEERVDVVTAAETDAQVFSRPDDATTTESGQREVSRSRVRTLLSVHALGQCVYCLRSAILAAERGDERDIDEPHPRLTFLPNFDRERIEEMLSLKLKQLAVAIVLIVCLMVSMTLSAIDQNLTQFNLAALTFLLALLWAAHLLTCVVQLTIRRTAAMRAEAREPEPSFRGTQPVNWWSVLKAGFEPIRYQRPFQHPELPLEGCPWRVLQKGSRRIPVIRTGGDRLGGSKGKLYPKHEVRLVAYALLLEADGHLEVPYGLVFPVDSPRGLAFAITDELRERTVELLTDFQEKLVESQQRSVQPGLPENRNRCSNCDYGKPVLTSLREVDSARKAGEQVVLLQNRSDQVFRCNCGDRFGSAPPHRDSVRKGLRATLE